MTELTGFWSIPTTLQKFGTQSEPAAAASFASDNGDLVTRGCDAAALPLEVRLQIEPQHDKSSNR